MDFDQSHYTHTVFLTCLSPACFLCWMVGHHIKGFAALVLVLAMECAFLDDQVLMKVCDALCSCGCGEPGGVRAAHSGPPQASEGHHIFKDPEKHASQNKVCSLDFSHFLVSCCFFSVWQLNFILKEIKIYPTSGSQLFKCRLLEERENKDWLVLCIFK